MERQEKDIVKNMEYLVQLLYNEWECSGKTFAVVSVPMEESCEVNDRLLSAIQRNTQYLEGQETDFKESMKISKENFVLLRLVKKVKSTEDRMNKKAVGTEFSVELDKEEYRLFQKIVGIQEVK